MVAGRAVTIEPVEEIEVSALGAPGVGTIRVAPAPLRIVAVDGDALDDPILFTLAEPMWEPVTRRGIATEPDWQEGSEIVRRVSTSTYGWKLTCPCGRVRYAKANSRHQVRACRVCTRLGRLERRAKRQREARL
jgi:hypothetical protein